MAKTIEKQDIGRRALIIQQTADGSIEVRADYEVVTSEGSISRSTSYEPTSGELQAIKGFANRVFNEVKKKEGL